MVRSGAPAFLTEVGACRSHLQSRIGVDPTCWDDPACALIASPPSCRRPASSFERPATDPLAQIVVMHRFVVTLIAVGLLYGPGVLLSVAWLPARLQRWWVVLPIAPLIGLGASFSIGIVFDSVGLDVAPRLVATVVVAVAVGILLMRRRRLAWAEWRLDARELVDLLGLLAIGAVSFYAWVHVRAGYPLLPNYDAINHGLFVRRILEESTLDPSRVVVQDPVTDIAASHFYPLALHLAAAQVVRFASSSIPTALFLLTTLTASVSWPSGMYALARRLLPWRWAPLISAALAATMLQFPYKPISWGGLTSIVGVSLVPGLVALGLVVLRDSERTVLPFFAFGLGALFVLHGSQPPAVLILLATLGAGYLFRRETLQLLDPRTLALSAIAALIPTWGVLSDFLAGSDERPNLPSFYDSVGSLFGPLVTLSVSVPRVTLLPVLFLFGGIIASFALGVGRTVVLAYAAFAALVMFAGLDEWWTSPFRFLTSPWYAQYERVSYYLVIPVVLLGTIACCAVAELCVRAFVGRGRTTRVWRAVPGVIVGAVVVAVFYANTVNFIGAAKIDFAYWQRIDGSMLDIGDVASIVSTSPVQILAVPESGAMWLYVADPRLEPIGPFLGDSPVKEELMQLISRLPNAGHDPWVDAELDHYSIDYVFVNESGMNAAPATPSTEALLSNSCFEKVFASGSAALWKVCRAP
jgi:hypothetical protein